MEKLPPELKQHICGLLDRKGLRSVRLLSRTWAPNAALNLFENILITPLTMDRLRLIAQHEYIATCVRLLTFCTDLLPSILPEMWYEDSIWKCQWQSKENDSLRFHEYVLAYREQQRLRENNHKLSRDIVDVSIPMLKRLQWLRLASGRDLGYTNGNSCDPNQQWARIWCNLIDHILDDCGAFRRETEISSQFKVVLNAKTQLVESQSGCFAKNASTSSGTVLYTALNFKDHLLGYCCHYQAFS